MPQTSIRRLSLADLNVETLRRLIEHGEDLFVERKRQPPAGSGLGEAVASFANTLGGWLLLGVANDRSIVGFAPPERTDPQSHFGQVLAAQVDPLPPFVADIRSIDDKRVTVLRVFESADTPHVVAESGAVYVRDSRGKQPVTDQQQLLELARRGEEALARAYARFRELEIPIFELATFDRPDLVAVDDSQFSLTARASLLTVTPQFANWAISRAAVEACVELMQLMADAAGAHNVGPIVNPRARGFGVHWRDSPVGGRIAVDSGGIIGARYGHDQPGNSRLSAALIRRDWLPMVLTTIADALDRAEVVGRIAWHFWICLPPEIKLETGEGLRQAPSPFFVTRELTSPSTEEERYAIAGEVVREYVRAAGVSEFEEAPESASHSD